MKFQLICIFLAVSVSSIFAQITDAEMDVLRSKWKLELAEKADEKLEKWVKDEAKSRFADSMSRIFFKDTFQLDQLLKKQIRKDPSNLGISKANMACMSEYEKLVDVYFAVLASKMKTEDTALVIASQANWKQYMEDERKLCGKLMQKEYSGSGGTAHAPLYTERLKNLSRNRLLELAGYLVNMI